MHIYIQWIKTTQKVTLLAPFIFILCKRLCKNLYIPPCWWLNKCLNCYAKHIRNPIVFDISMHDMCLQDLWTLLHCQTLTIDLASPVVIGNQPETVNIHGVMYWLWLRHHGEVIFGVSGQNSGSKEWIMSVRSWVTSLISQCVLWITSGNNSDNYLVVVMISQYHTWSNNI